jgi:hypothetical protein
MAEMLSNVIGAPFSDYVLTQLSLRAVHNSSDNRTNEEVLFLANKTAWVKLTSSVQVGKTRANSTTNTNNGVTETNPLLNQYYEQLLGTPAIGYDAPDSLRKNWVLEAGTSKSDGQGINLRYGLGPDGAYGLGGTEELGYRPMPGLTSVEVDTLGTLGSLRQATIQFKAWNMNQLNVMEALYFRLGYSMILEWGHTQFYQNSGSLVTNTYGLDLFTDPSRKEEIQQQITQYSANSSGNYQGMLGIVSNFNWSMNQEGGYDCSIKLIGLGSIIDSLRINSSYKIPDSLQQIYDQQQTLLKAKEEAAARATKEEERRTAGLTSTPVTAPKTPEDLYSYYLIDQNAVDSKSHPVSSLIQSTSTFLEQNTYYTADYATWDSTGRTLGQVNTVPDYYYKSTNQNQKQATEINNVSGLYLTVNPKRNTAIVIPADVTVDVPQPIYFNSTYLTDRIRQSAKQLDTQNTEDKMEAIIAGSTEYADLFGNFSVFEKLKYTNLIGPDSFPIVKIYGITNSIDFSTDYRKLLTEAFGTSTTKITTPTTVLIPYLNQTESNKSIFFIAIKYAGGNATPVELQSTLADWLINRGEGKTPFLNVDSINTTTVRLGTGDEYNDLYYTGTITGKSQGAPSLQIITNDTQYIYGISSRPTKPTTSPALPEVANSGDTTGDTNGTTSSQTDSGPQFNSALHVMLNVVKNQILAAAYGKTTVTEVPLLATTKLFYNDGILNGVLTGTTDKIQITNPTTDVKSFDLLQYALKGFNSNLMANSATYPQVVKVDFRKLCLGYSIPYTLKDNTGTINFPTYIKLGYLLAFLNNMCLIYDSKVDSDSDKRPYVYLDFNPETNLCLSNPQHLSVDPRTCMIPFYGNANEYASIFPEGVARQSLGVKGNIALVSEKANLNGVSPLIPGFKDSNQYQGKTMEILLNIDFLLRVASQYISTDKENVLNLKGFLDTVVDGINKSVGNINLFRVAYRDDSNTVIIKDDQFVPPLAQESWCLSSDNSNFVNTDKKYSVPDGPEVARYGLLPIFGKKSLVRDLQFQTNLSTAISKEIAISAQASTGSVNSTDHSAYSYLNANYSDAFKPIVSDAAKVKSVVELKKETEQKERVVLNDIQQAGQFNQHLVSIYNGGNQFSEDKIEMAINYYINSMSKIKAGDPITTSAPFIPANLSITLDGIGGIVMGNAFTIPQDRLPLSLRSNNLGFTKVGFVVVGLTHTIQNNQWLTKIRGQMIKLRDSTNYGKVKSLSSATTNFTQVGTGLSAIKISTPWSAAFISYVAQQAAGITDFPIAAAHTTYAQSLRVNNRDFEILDPTSTVLKPGDIIVKNRNGNSLTFSTKNWSGDSHGDIVVSVTNTTAQAIGGNVSDTVYKSNIGLTDGKLGRSDYFVVLRSKTYANSLVAAANKEYQLWKSGNWTEQSTAALSTLAKYYKIIGINV